MRILRFGGSSLKRGALLGVLLAWGAPIVVASCGSSPSLNGLFDAGGGGGNDSGTPDSTSGPDVTAPEGAAPDSPTPPVPLCPPPAGLRPACDGTDPRIIFYPPVACDPKALDAGSFDAGPDADAGPCDGVTSSDVSFTPAACRSFVDLEAAGNISQDPTRAPTFAEPADGDALTADVWSIFAWTKGPQARSSPVDWLEPSAHALTPLTGDGYVIQFSQGCTEILRAMVATTFWAPDPTSWNRLVNLQGPVTVRVYWAKFDKNGIASGIVASAPIKITMTK